MEIAFAFPAGRQPTFACCSHPIRTIKLLQITEGAVVRREPAVCFPYDIDSIPLSNININIHHDKSCRDKGPECIGRRYQQVRQSAVIRSYLPFYILVT
jgi:hypothetical protein